MFREGEGVSTPKYPPFSASVATFLSIASERRFARRKWKTCAVALERSHWSWQIQRPQSRSSWLTSVAGKDELSL